MIGAAADFFDITPKRAVPLAGYSTLIAPFKEIATPLEVNICILRDRDINVAIIAIDCLFVGSDFEHAVRRQLADPSVKLIFVASHTHSAPSLDHGKPALGAVDQDYFAETVQCIASAVRRLVAGGAVAAKLRYGLGRCAGAIYRRRRATVLLRRFPFIGLAEIMAPNRTARTHDEIQTLEIGGDGRGPAAIIWCWPCHAVASPEPAKLGADFPGHVRAALRKKYNNPQLAILYFPGFSGDIRPCFTGTRFSPRNLAAHPFMAVEPFAAASREEYAAFCAQVAETAGGTLDAAIGFEATGRLALNEVSIPLTDLLEGTGSDNLEITLLDLGPISFLLFGAEVCSPYLGILGRYFTKPVIFSGCVGETYGYLPTDRQIAEGGYEAEGFQKVFPLRGRYRKHVEPVICAAVEMT